ncbi:MAG: hypothetical protein WCD70_10830 [Alphaproteobacteria bacterium]
MSMRFLRLRALIIALSLSTTIVGAAFARDAAFLDPGAANAGLGDEAVRVDPKAEIDIGDTVLNVAKRTSIFFVNETNVAVKIEKIAINNDSNVTAEASADDCMKQGSIAPLSRCSVEISTTPTSPGSWSVDVLMTHNGAGRITRARLTGKTSGSGVSKNESTGLSVNAKDTKPVDFGDVTIGDGKIVRSTLMVNDSPDPITIYSIDVIEADNGLQRLDQGCAVDMELAPGASCPVTLLWVPKVNGPISTDLIIRHSGKLGFAVIPIRGMAKGGESLASTTSKPADDGKKGGIPMPPSEQELDKAMAGKIALVAAEALGGSGKSASTGGGDGMLHLIGTVGSQALMLKPSGETIIVPTGGEFNVGERTGKLVAVGARSADVVIEGKKKTLVLEAADSLIAKATQAQQGAAAPQTATAAAKTPSLTGTLPANISPANISPITGGVMK